MKLIKSGPHSFDFRLHLYIADKLLIKTLQNKNNDE